MTPTAPLPFGYVEVQRCTAGFEDWPALLADAAREAQTLAGQPVTLYAKRREVVPIPERPPNVNLYLGFVPVDANPAKPLNPSNMNDAEQYALGQLVDNLDYPETRF